MTPFCEVIFHLYFLIAHRSNVLAAVQSSPKNVALAFVLYFLGLDELP